MRGAGLAVAGCFVVEGRWRRLVEIVLVVGVGMLINAVVKEIFDRPRPVFDEPHVELTTYSFPSGHAAAAALMYGYLASLAWGRWRSWRGRVSVVMAAVLAVLLVAFSRMALGVHYLSDVVAAVAEAGVWLAVVLVSVETVARRRRGSAGRAAGREGP